VTLIFQCSKRVRKGATKCDAKNNNCYSVLRSHWRKLIPQLYQIARHTLLSTDRGLVSLLIDKRTAINLPLTST
jgi:hypothetical protein